MKKMHVRFRNSETMIQVETQRIYELNVEIKVNIFSENVYCEAMNVCYRERRECVFKSVYKCILLHKNKNISADKTVSMTSCLQIMDSFKLLTSYKMYEYVKKLSYARICSHVLKYECKSACVIVGPRPIFCNRVDVDVGVYVNVCGNLPAVVLCVDEGYSIQITSDAIS